MHIKPKTNRCSSATLVENLCLSDLSGEFKNTAIAIHQALAAWDILDDVVLIAEASELHAAIVALTPAGMDLFRILRAEPPRISTFSRQNISAQLRHARRRTGRAPVRADFASGHIVTLMAAIYYGGLERWGEGIARRTQHPKGHWRTPSSQKRELFRIAAQWPDRPLTHETLRAVGAHSLASAISGRRLTRLCQELGLNRRMKKSPNGTWTQDHCVRCYIAECDAAGNALSAHQLRLRGGRGQTIATIAPKLFGSFEAMRQYAGKIDPSLRPEARPTAADGTAFDSHAERAFYETAGKYLPAGTRIEVHVMLGAELPNCSADMLIGGRVFVEILMFSIATIGNPRTPAERGYARKWLRKLAWYRQQAMPLVVVEPADGVCATKLRSKAAEIAVVLEGVPVLPTQAGQEDRRSAGFRPRKPRGYWNFATVVQHVLEVAAAAGSSKLPTIHELERAGYVGAACWMRRRGRRARVVAATGLKLTTAREKHCWTRERVIAELVAFTTRHGCYPSGTALRQAGLATLAGTRVRLFPKDQATLRQKVREELARRTGTPDHTSDR